MGSDVWIGLGATILSGVHIGHGAIVGTKALVTKNVPPYAVVAGNPARVVRMRFDNSTIARLLKVAWWDWSHERIEEALHRGVLQSEDKAAFLDWAESAS